MRRRLLYGLTLMIPVAVRYVFEDYSAAPVERTTLPAASK